MSKTDWKRVKREAAQDAPISHDPGDGPYDPNDERATEAFLGNALLKRPGQRGSQKSPTKQLVSLRLSEEVLEHFKAAGPGWQTRIDDALKRVVRK